MKFGKWKQQSSTVEVRQSLKLGTVKVPVIKKHYLIWTTNLDFPWIKLLWLIFG